jgi:hypothetical protein
MSLLVYIAYIFYFCFLTIIPSELFSSLLLRERPLSCVEREKNDMVQLVLLFG